MMMKRGQRVLTVFIVLFVMSVTWLVSPFYTYGAELTGNGTVSENDSMDREETEETETEETETEETEKEGKGNVLQEEAAGDDHGQDSITIEPDGTLFGQSDVYIKVTGGSLIETTETDPDWSLHYNQAASKLTLKNFRYTVGNDDRYEYAGIGFYATTDGQEGSAFKTLQLELIGENSVSCPRGEALSVAGSLDITAPAHRHRPGHGHGAGAGGGGRAHLRPGRVHPRPGAQPDEEVPAGEGPDLPLQIGRAHV